MDSYVLGSKNDVRPASARNPRTMPPSTPITAAEKFRKLLSTDDRYDPEAYNFLYEALDFTLKSVVSPRSRGGQHVSGQELLEGLRRYSIEQFGCLSQMVLEHWGLRSTDDVGEMVFNLVSQDLMGKQESDSKDDFHEVFAFDDAFGVRPVFSYCPERREWKATYIARKSRMRR